MTAMTSGGQSDSAPETVFRSGMEILYGAVDRRSFEAGVALVEEAAGEGHPDAICQVAAFEALGAARPPNWSRAFDLLQEGAERGSRLAQGQLRLLVGNAPQEQRDWAALRSQINLRQLLRAPEPSILSDRPRIGTISGFATPATCDWIIDRFRRKVQRAMVWDRQSNVGQVDPARSNSAVEVRITDGDVVIAVVRERISAAIGIPQPNFEVPQVMHYTPGQEFKPHHDFLNPLQPGQAADIVQRGQRIATFLIFLNDDFEGGETEFPYLSLRHRGRKGDALYFHNVGGRGKLDLRTLHAGLPVSSGEKWIVSQWIRDRMPAV